MPRRWVHSSKRAARRLQRLVTVCALGVTVIGAGCARDDQPVVIPDPEKPARGILSVAESHVDPAPVPDGIDLVVRVVVHNALARSSSVEFREPVYLDEGVAVRALGFARCARACTGGFAHTDKERAEATSVDLEQEIELTADESAFLVLELAFDGEIVATDLSEGCDVGLRSVHLSDNGQTRHLTGPEGFIAVIRDHSVPAADATTACG